MPTPKDFQDQIIQLSRGYNRPLPDAVKDAFARTPRHLFIRRYSLDGQLWHEVDEANLSEHLGNLYRDAALTIHKDDRFVSTISQPSFMLFILDLLGIDPGHRIFELGAGTGWFAAMMGRLAGGQGKVASVEIIPEIAALARENIAKHGPANVEILEGDAGDGASQHGPYDRMVFMAGSYDLPQAFFTQSKPGSLLLMILKNQAGGDCLVLFKKQGSHFESLFSMNCGFVPVVGRHAIDLSPMDLEAYKPWQVLKARPKTRVPCWWGGTCEAFGWRAIPIQTYVSIVDPRYHIFRMQGGELHWGLLDEKGTSLALALDRGMAAYGTDKMLGVLKKHLRDWMELGMPDLTSFKIKAYPSPAKVRPGKGSWLVKRRQAQFLYTLPKGPEDLKA